MPSINNKEKKFEKKNVSDFRYERFKKKTNKKNTIQKA